MKAKSQNQKNAEAMGLHKKVTVLYGECSRCGGEIMNYDLSAPHFAECATGKCGMVGLIPTDGVLVWRPCP